VHHSATTIGISPPFGDHGQQRARTAERRGVRLVPLRTAVEEPGRALQTVSARRNPGSPSTLSSPSAAVGVMPPGDP
jgi:hypothetical protein